MKQYFHTDIAERERERESILPLIATISYGFKCFSRISVFGKMGISG